MGLQKTRMPVADETADAAEMVAAAGMVPAGVAAAADGTVAALAAFVVAAFSCCPHRSRLLCPMPPSSRNSLG